MANLGSLVVSLEANIARFETDLKKAESVAKGAFERIEKAGNMAASATKALGMAIVGISAGVGINTLVSKFESVTQSLAGLKDMSEKTGASVENLSALAGVAKMTGQSMDLVEGGITRLSKALAGADDESKGAAHALAEVGLSAENMRKMDPAEAYKLIADKLNEYRDGLGKTAWAQDVFGKSGAEQLVILKALAESGDLVAKSTTEQANEAREYIRTVNQLTAAKDALYKVIAVQVLPVVSDLVKVLLGAKNETTGVQKAVKDLAADGSIRSWAETGAMAVAHLLDEMSLIKHIAVEVATPIERLGQNIKGLSGIAAIAANTNTSFSQKFELYDELEAEQRKAFAALDARLARNREPTTLYADRLRATIGASAAQAKVRAAAEEAKPGLDHQSREPKGNKVNVRVSADNTSAFDTYVDQIDKMIKRQDESEYSAMRLKLSQLALKESVSETADRFSGAVEKIEQYRRSVEANQLEKFADGLRKTSDEFQFQTAIMNKTANEQEQLTIARRNALMVENMIAQAEQSHLPLSIAAQDKLRQASADATNSMLKDLEARRAADEDWVTGAQRAYDNYMETSRNVAKKTEDYFTNAYRGIEGAMADFLFNPFDKGVKGMLSSFGQIIQRMIAEAAAADLSKRLFGAVGTPSSGGWLSGLMGMLGMGGSAAPAAATGAAGGAAAGGMFSFESLFTLPGFAVGTDYVPRDMVAKIHQGEKIIPAAQNTGASDPQINITVHVNGNSNAPDVRRAAGQGAREALAAIQGVKRYG